MTEILNSLTEQVNGLLNASPAAVMLGLLIGLGALLKRTPHVPDWCIPWILPVVAMIFGPFVIDVNQGNVPAVSVGPDLDIVAIKYPWAQKVLYSGAIGSAATGVYQAVKQFRGRKADALAENLTPPPTNKP